ncbi:MAG: hypothetical protein HFJ10_05085 [Lachnospiraceae bacterium]|nr:hypothetical protein [Lachnospiraceae bacterium]
MVEYRMGIIVFDKVLVVSVIIGVGLGVIAACKPYSVWDTLASYGWYVYKRKYADTGRSDKASGSAGPVTVSVICGQFHPPD